MLGIGLPHFFRDLLRKRSVRAIGLIIIVDWRFVRSLVRLRGPIIFEKPSTTDVLNPVCLGNELIINLVQVVSIDFILDLASSKKAVERLQPQSWWKFEEAILERLAVELEQFSF